MIFNNLFEMVKNKNKTSLAIISEEETLTYQQLIDKVLLLKKKLNKINKQKKLIAIACGKNIDFICWQIAVNYSKNVFLPLNGDFNQRFFEILSLSVPDIIILPNNLSPEEKKLFKNSYQLIEQLTYSSVWLKTKNDKIKRKFSISKADYLIYSSGSTGFPKGILLNIKSLINVVNNQSKIFNINNKSIVGWLLNPGFDASLSDIYTAFYQGATLCIINKPIIQLKKIIEIINYHKITHLDLPPTLLNIISPDKLPYLKTIIFGGEPTNQSTINKWLLSGKNLFNAYGPTEACICSSIKKFSHNIKNNNIGQPLKKYKYAITDNGELLISSPNLAIGYTDHNLTKQRFFIKNKIRWYKTNDLVKTITDDYYYLGRLDRQFKYNGVLICPEELEEFVKNHGAVQAKCLLENDKIKLFYVGEINEDILKNKINNYFPQFMRPHFYQKINSFALNQSGKTAI